MRDRRTVTRDPCLLAGLPCTREHTKKFSLIGSNHIERRCTRASASSDVNSATQPGLVGCGKLHKCRLIHSGDLRSLSLFANPSPSPYPYSIYVYPPLPRLLSHALSPFSNLPISQSSSQAIRRSAAPPQVYRVIHTKTSTLSTHTTNSKPNTVIAPN